MKTILITGSTSGLGTFLANHFASNGHKLLLHAKDSNKSTALLKQLGSYKAEVYLADFLKPTDIIRMYESIAKNHNKIDVLINNAFGKLEVPIYESTTKETHDFFQISLAGTVEIIRGCIPFLKKAMQSNIINIVADWGNPMHNIMTGPSQYISAKYGVHGLGVALQTELIEFGIKTTNIFPGVIASDMGYDQEVKEYVDKYNDKAIYPGDIAKTIDFVINQEYCHVRNITLTPNDPKYNGN